MPKYNVDLPFAGFVTVFGVEAESEEAAIEAAFDVADIKIQSDGDTELSEWEILKQIVRGNVCYAPLFEASASEADDEG